MDYRKLLKDTQELIEIKENQFNEILDENMSCLLSLELEYLRKSENEIYRILKEQKTA